MSTSPRKRVIGRYLLGPRIGQGGQGEVFRAQDQEGGDLIALKLFRLGIDESAMEETRSRVNREVECLRMAKHRGIVSVRDVGYHPSDDPVNDGYLYIAYDLIDGSDLSIALTRPVPPSPRDAVELLEALCQGLAYAHEHDLVHRDIKPSNIRLRQDVWSDPVIVDFGCVRIDGATTLTATVDVIGTLAYMAPEVQQSARNSTVYSDQWSLARLAAEAVAVALEEGYEEVRYLNARDLLDDFIAPTLPTVAEVLQQSLQPIPSDRHESVLALGRHFVDAALIDSWIVASSAEADVGEPWREGEPLVDYLIRSGFATVDKRSRSGGNLWVIADEARFAAFRDALRLRNVFFKFSPNGGRASKDCPAWYTNTME